jgi:hypothetical protein
MRNHAPIVGKTTDGIEWEAIPEAANAIAVAGAPLVSWRLWLGGQRLGLEILPADASRRDVLSAVRRFLTSLNKTMAEEDGAENAQ